MTENSHNIKKFKDIFNDTLKFYMKEWFSLFLIALVFIIPTIVIDNTVVNNEEIWFGIARKVSILASNLALGFLGIVIFAFFLLCLTALLKSIQAADKGESLNPLQSYKIAFRQTGALIIAIAFYITKVFLWSLALIIPGIIFAIAYGLAPMAAVMDGKKGNEALVYSKALIKPHWVKYLDYHLFCFIFILAVCAPIIVFLDKVIYYFLALNREVIAQAVDYTELAVVILGLQFYLVFCFFVYKELKTQGGQS